jgi:hypothetical protein
MASPSTGGAFVPGFDYKLTGDWDFSEGSVTLPAGQAVTSPVINGTITGTAVGNRVIKTGVLALAGAALHAGIVAWTNPEGADIIVLRAVADITTASTGASTLDIGLTAVSATTTSDTLLDGISGTPAAVFDSMNAALDSGANAKAQKLAAGKWVTVDEATGDTTGLVGNLYISYVVC